MVWEFWWFWSLIGLFLIGSGIGLFQLRIYYLREIESVRRRIADDLHDDFSSKLSSNALQVDWLRNQLGKDHPLDEVLATISNENRALVDELRSIVWLIGPESDSLEELVERMYHVKNQMLVGFESTFQLPQSVPDAHLTLEQRRHVFLAYKEVLHNIVRHSGATKVSIDINVSEENFGFEVKDNGIGFDLQKVSSGIGVNSLRSRAEELNGSVDIISKPGNGTLIRFKAPSKLNSQGSSKLNLRLEKAELIPKSIIRDISRTYDEKPRQIKKLFISYSHKDKIFVDHLEGSLAMQQIRVWIDHKSATAGPLEKIVIDAMEDATVLLVLSNNSVQSDWVELKCKRQEKWRSTLRIMSCVQSRLTIHGKPVSGLVFCETKSRSLTSWTSASGRMRRCSAGSSRGWWMGWIFIINSTSK